MEFLEKDLEEIIFNAGHDQLIKKGLSLRGRKYRQLRIGNYGVSDLIYVSKEYRNFIGAPILNINVVELKKDNAGISAFLQAVRYCKGVSDYLNLKHPSIDFTMEITLIGKSIDISGDFVYLADLISSRIEGSHKTLHGLNLYSYNYTFDGVEFEEHEGYSLKNNGFNINQSKPF